MKRHFLVLMGATAMMFASSCQKEMDFGGETGTPSEVSFQVATPEIATRAYSDGQTATVLQYAVYNADGEEMTELTVTDATINGSTTVNLKLTTGNTYSVIFWAAAPDAPYTVDLSAKKMTVDYEDAVSNDEKRDAFYKYHTFTVKGAQTETIELKRPFAQLNIGTNDYDESKAAGYAPAYSYVKVPVSSELNLVDGTVNTAADVEFALAAVPAGEEYPVDGYEYLAMNYLLVAADKEVVDLTFGYSENSETVEKTRTVGSVPVQRNHRTNIYGQLFTSNVDINVEIKPEYDEPSHELDALLKAALNGGEVTLTEDVVLTTTLEVMGNMTINLNGKTISGEVHKSVGPVIKNNGTLKINGGTISSVEENGGSAIANYGNLTVENATINGAPQAQDGSGWPAYPINNYGDLTLTNTTVVGYQGCIALNAAGTTIVNDCALAKEYLETSSHVFYVNNADAKVIINGGTYTHNGFDGSLVYAVEGEVVINDGTFNAKDGGYGPAVLTAGKIVINGGNINAGLLNWGGQFVINSGIFASEPDASYLAEGYKAVSVDGKWMVISASVGEFTVVTESTADFAEAISTNNTEKTMFEWNDVYYVAEYGAVAIYPSAESTTTVRGIVEYSAVKEATVAEGITNVGNRTFRKCASLETVVLPNSLTEIGPAVFQSCTNLANITIPASVTTIGEGAFAECKSLTSINIPEGVERIEKDVLRATGLVSVEFPASVTYFGEYAFRDCDSLTEVVINAPSFTVEANTFLNAAAPVPTMTIKVANDAMKSYLESKLDNYHKTFITVVVM